MKIYLKITLTIFTVVLFSFIKSDDIIGHLPENNTYILDSIRQIRNSEIFPTLCSDLCYLKINNGYGVLSVRGRKYAKFTSGKLQNPIVKIFEGDTVNVFTLVGDNRISSENIGVRTFIGIPKDFDNEKTIYLLNATKSPELFLKSHLATNEEL